MFCTLSGTITSPTPSPYHDCAIIFETMLIAFDPVIFQLHACEYRSITYSIVPKSCCCAMNCTVLFFLFMNLDFSTYLDNIDPISHVGRPQYPVLHVALCSHHDSHSGIGILCDRYDNPYIRSVCGSHRQHISINAQTPETTQF